MILDLLKSMREVKACEKHLGYALYRSVVDDCDDCLRLVLAHCAKVAPVGEVCGCAVAIRRAFGAKAS